MNLHILHLITRVPEETLDHRCKVGSDEPVTLRFLVTDYVRDLKHHLEQIEVVV